MQSNNHLLTDEQIIQFITQGYVVLHNDLPNELHLKVMSEVHEVLMEEGNPGNNILPRVPDIQKFFETPVVRGALTGILGPDYYLHPHRHCHYNQPANQNPGGGQWHKDGYWSAMRSHRPWWAMVFYYTQAVTEELGPTAIMPGSQYNEAYPGNDKPFLLPTGPAGTMVLVHFDLWHKASLNTSTIDRYMLKFQFARLKAPSVPDWNHKDEKLQIPEGISDTQLPIWLDVWSWLKGETKDNAEQNTANLSSLAGLVAEEEEDTALQAAYLLAEAGEVGIQELLKILNTGTNKAANRAAYAIIAAGAKAVPGLIELQKNTNAERRGYASFALGMIGSPQEQILPALIHALSDESNQVRRQAAEAIGMVKQPTVQAVSALAQILIESVAKETDQAESDPESNQDYITNKIGYGAALSLLRVGKHGDAGEVIEALSKALDSKDRYVRAYAFEALTYLRTEEAVDVLLRYYRTARWCPSTHKGSIF